MQIDRSIDPDLQDFRRSDDDQQAAQQEAE
jgi:hypothetical protein